MIGLELQDRLTKQAKQQRGQTARAAVKSRNPIAKDADLQTTPAHKSGPSRAQASKALKVSERKLRNAAQVRKADPLLAKKVNAAGQ